MIGLSGEAGAEEAVHRLPAEGYRAQGGGADILGPWLVEGEQPLSLEMYPPHKL